LIFSLHPSKKKNIGGKSRTKSKKERGLFQKTVSKVLHETSYFDLCYTTCFSRLCEEPLFTEFGAGTLSADLIIPAKASG
jgi:hypothetical protein